MKNYAGFWLRFWASLLDAIILSFVLYPMYIISSGEVATPTYAISLTLNVIIVWLYFAVMESSRRQGTIGKIALGIKVTDVRGKRIGFGTATVRFFGKYLSSIILYIGFFMIAFTEKKQGLHDIIAKTLVVDEKHRKKYSGLTIPAWAGLIAVIGSALIAILLFLLIIFLVF